MSADQLDYETMAREALRGVVRAALERAAAPEGLPGDHYFYIGFKTTFPGAVVPPRLLEDYPDEMTIVIKRHYWDLEVTPDLFRVGLSFNQKPERLTVPFAAVTRFTDPSAQFGLVFDVEIPEEPPEPERPSGDEIGDDGEGGGRVVSLDAFRKKS